MYVIQLIAVIVLGLSWTTVWADHLAPSDHVEKWENGIVPVEIRGTFLSKELDIINAAIDKLHQKTCVKFIQRTNENDFVIIDNGPTGCWASVGRVGGSQMLNLQNPQCVNRPGTVLHELLHILGFVHEEHDDDDFYPSQNKDHPKAIVAKLNIAKLAKEQADADAKGDQPKTDDHKHEEHTAEKRDDHKHAAHDHDDHKHEGHDHDDHKHEGHDHHHHDGDDLGENDLKNLLEMYNCQKPTGTVPALTSSPKKA